MSIQLFRYVFAAVWLVTGLLILFREPLGITYFDDRWSDQTLGIVAVVALALAVRNGFRAWMDRQRNRPRAERPNPLRPRGEDRPFEYNPELDFNKPA